MTSRQVQQIIDTLKNAASNGFELLVKQQVVIGVQEALGALVLFVMAIVAWKVGTRILAEVGEPRDTDYNGKKNGDYTDAQAAITVAAWVLRIVMLGVGVGVGSWLAIDSVGHFINPAGYAITNLLPGH